MSFDQTLAARVRRSLALRKNVEEIKMFGGLAFLPNGNVAVGVWRDSLVVRVGPDDYEEALLEPHVQEFDITGRPMKGWVVVEPEGVAGEERLNGWIHRAMTFVETLPRK